MQKPAEHPTMRKSKVTTETEEYVQTTQEEKHAQNEKGLLN